MVLFDVSLPQHPDQPELTTAEMSAILAVSKALSALEDRDARLRVLRWANDRFNGPAEFLTETSEFLSQSADSDLSSDASLSVDSLESLFETPAQKQDELPRRASWEELAREEIGDLFDEPLARGRAGLRVVARNDAPAAAAHEELANFYDAAAHDRPKAHPYANAHDHEAIDDVFDTPPPQVAEEPVFAEAIAFEEPAFEPLSDDAVMLLEVDAVLDDAEPAAVCLEEAAREEAPAVPVEEQSLDTLLSDLANSLEALTLQFKDVTA